MYNLAICSSREIYPVYVMYVYVMLAVQDVLCIDIVLHTGVGVQVKSVLDSASLNVH